jgi:hypothetical protein
MPIRFKVRSNKMVGKEDEYAAQVVPAFTADIEDVVERATQQGSGVSKAAMLAAVEAFFSTAERMVLEGIHITTPLVNIHTSITGTFKGHDDRFDRRRHRIEARVTPGKRLRRTVRLYGRAVRVAGTSSPLPAPVFFEDIESGQKDSALTPGGLGRLYGIRLKFDPADPRQGVFFIGADRRATRAGPAAENHPKQVILLVPPLAPGDYTLEVRARAEDSDEVRSGRLPATLTVPEVPILELPPAWASWPEPAVPVGAAREGPAGAAASADTAWPQPAAVEEPS